MAHTVWLAASHKQKLSVSHSQAKPACAIQVFNYFFIPSAQLVLTFGVRTESGPAGNDKLFRNSSS